MKSIKVRELLRILRAYGCEQLRQKGSHRVMRCGTCQTTVAGNPGDTIPSGTMRKIEKHLEPCLGEQWLERATR